MRKLYLLIAILTTLTVDSVAQSVTEGSLAALGKATRVNLDVDFSHASILGMSEEEFADYEKDWEEDKPEVLARFMNEAMEAVGNAIALGHYKSTPYTLKVVVLSVSGKGNFDCDAFLQNEAGETLARIEGIHAKGGNFGTKLNLIKDGAEHSGKALGSFLKKELKKHKSK